MGKGVKWVFINLHKYNSRNVGLLLVMVTIIGTLLLFIGAGAGLAENSQAGNEDAQSPGTAGSESATPPNPLKVVVNDKEIYSDVPVVIRGGRLFLPVRFLAESLDLPVDWDAATRTVYIGARPTGVDLVRELPVASGLLIKNPVKIKGVGYPTGYILSDSLYNNLEWNFNKRYHNITFGFGVADNSKNRTAGFEVIADGRRVGRETVTKDDGLKEFSYNIKGVKVLVIKSNGGAGGAVINPRALKNVKK